MNKLCVLAAILATLLLVTPLIEAQLTYPGDCDSSKLIKFAKKCGLTVTGSKHNLVHDGEELVTTIPHSVKGNNTCRSIIKTLNERCTK